MMSSCCCSLAGTRACFTCPNGPNQYSPYMTYPVYYQNIPQTYPSPSKKITEKYDKDGKLIERIIEG